MESLNGVTATLRVPGNLTINDYDSGKSPIDLRGNANLTLVVSGSLFVTGGKAVMPPIQTVRLAGTVSTGGFAGIAVPTGTTLTVRGTGSLIARGGDGADSNGGTSGQTGGAGGAGAGAGIGGNGGNGGLGGWEKANDGANGGSAGTVNIYERVKVTAYGGAGGATTTTLSPGGGGYPAAGIGGGGAGGGGGPHPTGGGGFTSSGYAVSGGGKDGTGPTVAKIDSATSWHRYTGGAYFNGPLSPKENNISMTGGYRAISYTGSGSETATSGGGGTAGSGGTVRKANTATLTVANGSYVTANKQKWGQSPTPIYMQSGYKPENVRASKITSVAARTGAALTSELNGKVTKSVEPFKENNVAIYGIGSGAGAKEISNGYYIPQNVPSQVAAPAVTVPAKGSLKV